MASTEIIPIIQHPFSSSSPTISATVDTMLIKEYGNKDGNQHPFFLQLTSQATAAANFKRQRRRRVSRESILPGHNVGHAVAVTFLAVRLCFRVLRCLWIVSKWIARFLSLGCYVAFIFPGLLQVAYYYLHCGQIRRSIKYGDQPRNRLDIYLPKTGHGQRPKPVVAFVTGGAWIMGYYEYSHRQMQVQVVGLIDEHFGIIFPSCPTLWVGLHDFFKLPWVGLYGVH